VRGEGAAAELGGEAFASIVAEHTPALYRFARHLVRDPDEAEDLVQETFLRAYRARERFRGDAPVRIWLRRILHNLAVDRARRDREMPVAEIQRRWMDDAYTVDAEAVVERAERREELQDALVRLPFIYRSAVVLHDVEGWTVEDIAASLGIGVPAAKQRLRRGRMMLVTALARGHERRQALAGVPLRCWEARRRISDYLDGGLAPGERATLEEHLARCPTCPPLYACLVGVCERLGGMRDPDTVIPPDLAGRVMRAVEDAGRIPPRRGPRPD
jgi:RNA polymerase sigma-70 factor (ECF subfamily)